MRPRTVVGRSVLAEGIVRYLTHQRALGRRFRTEERELCLLDHFLAAHGLARIEDITAAHLAAFLASRPRHRPRSSNHLLGAVRRLFEWLVSQALLPASPLCATPRRATAQRGPFLFDAALARRLLAVAASLPDTPGAPLRGLTDRTIFALLYGLGLRVGEVARLHRDEVDGARAVLLGRAPKFGKSRLVPFGPQMATLLRDYLERSGAHRGPLPLDAPVFSFRQGRAVHPGTISQTFHQLVPRLALTIPPGTASPRVHDLRHAFAVGTLVRWYRAGIAPADRLLQLSTFLGHVHPTSTAVYLTVTADTVARSASAVRRLGRAAPAGAAAMTPPAVGARLYAFFAEHLTALNGLRPTSIQSYRDTLRLFLRFVAADRHCRLTQLTVADLSCDRVRAFLRHLEEARHNQIRTRNQRRAALHAFFEYLASTGPEHLAVAPQVAAIPVKRCPPPETHFLERDQIQTLSARLPTRGRHAARDRALLLFLYNTGARVQEVSDLCRRDLDLGDPPRVRLHGKGDKWRTCPLWTETARQLHQLFPPDGPVRPELPVFRGSCDRPLTRFGISKLVRRPTPTLLGDPASATALRRIGPHVFRHTTAVHLLEAGVEGNVIRGWLGHVSLETTNRSAEITVRAKEAALRTCEPPTDATAGFPRTPVWRNDEALLAWLASLCAICGRARVAPQAEATCSPSRPHVTGGHRTTTI